MFSTYMIGINFFKYRYRLNVYHLYRLILQKDQIVHSTISNNTKKKNKTNKVVFPFSIYYLNYRLKAINIQYLCSIRIN